MKSYVPGDRNERFDPYMEGRPKHVEYEKVRSASNEDSVGLMVEAMADKGGEASNNATKLKQYGQGDRASCH